MFDWKIATVVELAKKIATIPSAHTRSQLKFYERNNNEVIVNKILTATKLAEVYRLRLRADKLFEKLTKELGEDIANSNPQDTSDTD